MPITYSAKKALRGSHKKRVFNLAREKKSTQALKSVKKLIVEGKKKEAALALRTAQKMLDKAAKAHTLSMGTASRKISRLSKMIKKLG